MKFVMINSNGEFVERTYIQIGTVMTRPEYRRRGLAGKLVKEIVKDYRDRCDGIYLFGNLSALDFYSELGFWKSMQYRVSVKKDAAVKKSVCNSAFEQTNKFGMQMFYTGGFQNTYYSESLHCFASYECTEKTLYLNSIISDKDISVADVLAKIPEDREKIIVGFTPKDRDLNMFEFEEFDGADDYRLFCMGNSLKEIEENKLYFPQYSHA